MAPRNSNDWRVFGLSGDPVPGDPSSVQNVAQMLSARETAADLLIGGQADISVVQAAVGSGNLTVGSGPDQIPPGIVDGSGHVQDDSQFRAWFGSTGQNLIVAPTNDPHLKSLSLEEYVNRRKGAMAGHS